MKTYPRFIHHLFTNFQFQGKKQNLTWKLNDEFNWTIRRHYENGTYSGFITTYGIGPALYAILCFGLAVGVIPSLDDKVFNFLEIFRHSLLSITCSINLVLCKEPLCDSTCILCPCILFILCFFFCFCLRLLS